MLLKRSKPSKKSTQGVLFINGNVECATLEDIPREVKVYGETCIPAGRYEVVVTFSNRFKQDMPLLLKVPGFEGVRIHSGNTDKDTEGCILVGTSAGQDIVYNSRIAYRKLFEKIQGALKAKQKVFITIQWS